MTYPVVRRDPQNDDVEPVGPPTDLQEVLDEFDPDVIAEAEWEGRQ